MTPRYVRSLSALLAADAGLRSMGWHVKRGADGEIAGVVHAPGGADESPCTYDRKTDRWTCTMCGHMLSGQQIAVYSA